MKSAGHDIEDEILNSVASQDENLAERLCEQLSEVTLDDLPLETLQAALLQSETEIAVLALAGVSSDRCDQLFQAMSSNLAQQFRQQLAKLGMVRLNDIEEAQKEILRIVRHIEIKQRRERSSRNPLSELSA